MVPDNLRSAVTKANRYEPRLNDSYQKLANHYQTAVMPARPYKPKDKAKAENAVLLVERWIMMRLRHQTFHTFKELNLAIRELMNDLNEREMKQYGASRKALFDKLDKPALKPLPKQRYLYTETKRAKVGPDYHIEYRRHYYSVPHVAGALRDQRLKINTINHIDWVKHVTFRFRHFIAVFVTDQTRYVHGFERNLRFAIFHLYRSAWSS